MTENDWREQETTERYSTAIAAWSDAHGCEMGDLTKEQLVKFRAWEAAGCDATVANRLVACQWLVQRGSLA